MSISRLSRYLDSKCWSENVKSGEFRIQSCVFQGQAAATCCPESTTLDVNVFVDPVFLNISQYAIHTVDTAMHSWHQVTEAFLL